ncbi:hypothetical protein GCM10010341_64350 [Streptomyces noursei]|nr:hypothetical protein GCM10010341_64350 [Streptomyces noursei]
MAIGRPELGGARDRSRVKTQQAMQGNFAQSGPYEPVTADGADAVASSVVASVLGEATIGDDQCQGGAVIGARCAQDLVRDTHPNVLPALGVLALDRHVPARAADRENVGCSVVGVPASAGAAPALAGFEKSRDEELELAGREAVDLLGLQTQGGTGGDPERCLSWSYRGRSLLSVVHSGFPTHCPDTRTRTDLRCGSSDFLSLRQSHSVTAI